MVECVGRAGDALVPGAVLGVGPAGVGRLVGPAVGCAVGCAERLQAATTDAAATPPSARIERRDTVTSACSQPMAENAGRSAAEGA
jgi:hypothetical protein